MTGRRPPNGSGGSTWSWWPCPKTSRSTRSSSASSSGWPAALAEGGIDWGHAESLAYGSLLVDGIPIRFTGQDTERGTFSQRHLVFHDPETGERYAPIQHLGEAHAAFELHNSPLSEFGALGFEYGYSVAAPEALVLWEAQFGDFVNNAQVIVDQFLVSGLSKWRQTSRLTLLLPHGYEGNGPEHSSARLERFLQSAAQDNIRVATVSTSGQYFHLLRRQALDATPRPLVLMTPKGLLRLKEASSTLEDLAGRLVRAGDRRCGSRPRRRPAARALLGEGLLRHRRPRRAGRAQRRSRSRGSSSSTRFRRASSRTCSRSYPQLGEVVWAQEEPLNMGAYRSIRHRLEDALKEGGRFVHLRYVGRSWRASPSEGYPTAHLVEQQRIVRDALGVPHAAQ